MEFINQTLVEGPAAVVMAVCIAMIVDVVAHILAHCIKGDASEDWFWGD